MAFALAAAAARRTRRAVAVAPSIIVGSVPAVVAHA
jgi:hypothetical protein